MVAPNISILTFAPRQNIYIYMKSVRSIFIGLTCLGMATASFAQEEETTPEATTYKAEIFGSVASGDNTPFWMVSNRYGIVPLEANNGYFAGEPD